MPYPSKEELWRDFVNNSYIPNNYEKLMPLESVKVYFLFKGIAVSSWMRDVHVHKVHSGPRVIQDDGGRFTFAHLADFILQEILAHAPQEIIRSEAGLLDGIGLSRNMMSNHDKPSEDAMHWEGGMYAQLEDDDVVYVCWTRRNGKWRSIMKAMSSR